MTLISSVNNKVALTLLQQVSPIDSSNQNADQAGPDLLKVANGISSETSAPMKQAAASAAEMALNSAETEDAVEDASDKNEQKSKNATLLEDLSSGVKSDIGLDAESRENNMAVLNGLQAFINQGGDELVNIEATENGAIIVRGNDQEKEFVLQVFVLTRGPRDEDGNPIDVNNLTEEQQTAGWTKWGSPGVGGRETDERVPAGLDEDPGQKRNVLLRQENDDALLKLFNILANKANEESHKQLFA